MAAIEPPFTSYWSRALDLLDGRLARRRRRLDVGSAQELRGELALRLLADADETE